MIFLGSLLFPRPLVFHLAKTTVAKQGTSAEAFASNWSIPGFRFIFYLMTAVWGIGLVVEATLKIILAFTLPISEEQVGGLTPPIETDRQMAASVDWVKFILDRPMSSAPGDTFNYDSGNPHLLSAILTKLTGMSTLDYAKVKLFGPLGIKDKDVLWLPDQQGISHGGWGLYLQPRDMAKIGYLYLHNGVWEGKQLLPPEWVNKVSHPTVETHLKGFWYSNFFWVLPDKHV